MKIFTESIELLVMNNFRVSTVLDNVFVAEIQGRTNYIIPTGERCLVIEFSSIKTPKCTQEELAAIVDGMPIADMAHSFSAGVVSIVDVAPDIPGTIEAIGIPGTNLYFYISPHVYAIFEVFSTHATAAIAPAGLTRPRRLTVMSNLLDPCFDPVKALYCLNHEHLLYPQEAHTMQPSWNTSLLTPQSGQEPAS